MWYHMLFCSVPSTFKCTTLTPLYEVRSNRSFFSPLASCPLPRTQWRHLHFHKKWQQHSASWNNVLLYLQETTVGGLLFGISVSFCYFSRPFAKEKKKKRIQCFAFLYLLPLRAPRMLDKHPLIAGQAADRLTWPFGPCGANAPVPSPGITGR